MFVKTVIRFQCASRISGLVLSGWWLITCQAPEREFVREEREHTGEAFWSPGELESRTARMVTLRTTAADVHLAEICA